MTFATTVAEVIRITKRPDKSDDIKSQINRAIAFFTLKANFSRDLVENTLAISPTDFGATVAITSLTRFRKFKYLKPTGERYYLKSIDSTQLLTPQGNLQPNRYYVAGINLTYTLSRLSPSLEIGYYTYPALLVNDADTHWMLDMLYWAVVEKASAKIFQIIGDDASARFYEESSMEYFLAGRRDFEDQVSGEAS